MKRLRVLLIAEAANPDWASVPLVGWSHGRALFDVVDAHMVTQTRNVEAITNAGWVEGREFSALDTEPVARPLWLATEAIRKATGLGWTFDTAMQTLPYYAFETLLWRRFGREIAAGKWDLVHRLTPLSPTIPSIITPRVRAAGVPFVWGPINGGVSWPPGFGAVARREGEWLHYVRDAYRLLPGYRSLLKHASAITVGSQATLEQLPAEAQRRAVYLPENGIDEARFPVGDLPRATSPLRIAFVGRLVAYKGADVLIEAARDLLRAGKVVIDIIGDGPERGPLTALCEQLGVQDRVRIEGWVPHRELAARLTQSAVLGFPSVREFGGGVVLEAMALGLVPIVAAYAGPNELLTDDTGYRVPFDSRASLIEGVRRVLDGLVEDPSPLQAMGARARTRALSHFTWKAKAQQMLEVYRWALGQRGKPDFGMPLGVGGSEATSWGTPSSA